MAFVESETLISLPGASDLAWVVGAKDDAEGSMFTCSKKYE